MTGPRDNPSSPPPARPAGSVHLLHRTIDRAADLDPGHEAFSTPDRTVSYGELVARANAMANLLVDAGVRRGDRVGIFMPRSIESALSVYAIMRAGAAFVPIDPLVPVGGLRHLVEMCGIRHLATVGGQRDRLQALAAEATSLEWVIGIEDDLGAGVRTCGWDALEGMPDASPPPVTTVEDDLAYIMFSSGSTGRPKGIMHTHHSGLAYAALSVATYDVVPRDRIGNHSPLHFDMSTFGYLSAPYAAATTVLIPEAYTKLTASLSQLIEAQRMTIWYSVPLALIQLLQRGALETRDLRSLRWVLFGGEPFPVKHLAALMEQWPHARFSNVYGPAEVNQCTYHHVPPLEATSESIPIGRIWENTEGLVVDDAGEPVGPGGTGELLVHSATMMRGYWRRPDLNERAFSRRSVHGDLERTYYRTGDLVRIDGDGTLHFLGRRDRQVKIRGYRVELDEVEHVLTQHPDVEEAAVFPVREGDESRRIEAAVIPRDGTAPDPEELARFAAGSLSWYAVPNRIQVLPELPRTTSGKIDRVRLQADAETAPSPT